MRQDCRCCWDAEKMKKVMRLNAEHHEDNR
nr:hypothetical protein [Escherichia coli O25b:H4-ST131]